MEFDLRTDPFGLTKRIALDRIEDLLQPISIRSATRPVALDMLAGDTAVGLVTQVIQEDFIHQSFEAAMHLARLALGVITIAGRNDAQILKFESADNAFLLNRIACEATQVIEQQYLKIAAFRRRLHGLILWAIAITARDRGVGKRRDNRPAFCLSALPAVARLILDAGSALHVARVASVNGRSHCNSFCLGVLSVDTFSLPMQHLEVRILLLLALRCRFGGAWSDEFFGQVARIPERYPAVIAEVLVSSKVVG